MKRSEALALQKGDRITCEGKTYVVRHVVETGKYGVMIYFHIPGAGDWSHAKPNQWYMANYRLVEKAAD